MSKGSFLGEFEQVVLLAVLRLDDNAYGVTIRNEIETRTGRDAVMGAVYAALARLEQKGFIRGRVSKPEPVRGGRSRKLFRVTGPGTRALQRSMQMVARMAEGLPLESPS